MTSTHEVPPSIDEELGSPGLSLEAGWLAGAFLGLAVVVVVVHRLTRRRRGGAALPGITSIRIDDPVYG